MSGTAQFCLSVLVLIKVILNGQWPTNFVKNKDRKAGHNGYEFKKYFPYITNTLCDVLKKTLKNAASLLQCL